MAVFFARMVMPRSRSSGLESITRSAMSLRASSVPDWRRSWSTSVVLPWSTWAMMAMLRRFWITGARQGGWQKAAHYSGAPATLLQKAPKAGMNGHEIHEIRERLDRQHWQLEHERSNIGEWGHDDHASR